MSTARRDSARPGLVPGRFTLTARTLTARALTACSLAVCALAACGQEPDGPALPPTEGSFDYQLGGAYGDTGDFGVVARDSTSEPLPGAYSICYVNGFQTQPGATWPDELLLHDADGEPVVDPQWPDEYILDSRTEDTRTAIADEIGASIDRCAASGFDAVEIDNLDVWTRFPELLDEDSTLALASAYADRAHDGGLAIAQKNAPDGAATIKAAVGFDFAVSEECVAFDECDAYRDAYGSAVLDIEYTGSIDEICSNDSRPPMTILRDRDLTPPSDPAHTYRQCPPSS